MQKRQEPLGEIASGFSSSEVIISKRNSIFVILNYEIFFCSGWVEEPSIKPYDDYKDKYATKCNTAAFAKAMKKIEEYIVKKGVNLHFIILFRNEKSGIK